MNPSSNESIQLPPPVMEQAPPPSAQPESAQPVAEQGAPAAAERTPNAQASATPASAIPLPVPPIATTTTQKSDVSTTSNTSGPIITDDGDLIEKEWVNKAKHIVERTRDDPYKQSEELTVVKADYMKKRYDKTIKLSK